MCSLCPPKKCFDTQLSLIFLFIPNATSYLKKSFSSLPFLITKNCSVFFYFVQKFLFFFPFDPLFTSISIPYSNHTQFLLSFLLILSPIVQKQLSILWRNGRNLQLYNHRSSFRFFFSFLIFFFTFINCFMLQQHKRFNQMTEAYDTKWKCSNFVIFFFLCVFNL